MGDTTDVYADIPQDADDYALLWGGQDQHPGRQPANEKFAGELADAKRAFVEEFCERHWYLTAEFGFVYPDETIRDYDTAFEAVEMDTWLGHTHMSMSMGYFCVLEQACLWVLVDDEVLHREREDGKTLKEILDSLPYWVRYPFAGKDYDEKVAWIEDSLDVGFPLDKDVPLVGHS